MSGLNTLVRLGPYTMDVREILSIRVIGQTTTIITDKYNQNARIPNDPKQVTLQYGSLHSNTFKSEVDYIRHSIAMASVNLSQTKFYCLGSSLDKDAIFLRRDNFFYTELGPNQVTLNLKNTTLAGLPDQIVYNYDKEQSTYLTNADLAVDEIDFVDDVVFQAYNPNKKKEG